MSLLMAHELAKRYGADPVFAGVSLQIGAGDRIGLVGPNGSGKTTLLNLLAGRDEPDAGRVQVIGSARVGYLTQEAKLQGELSLLDELRSVFASLKDMEAEIRALESQLADGDAALLHRYDELRHAFETGGGYEVESRVHAVLDGLGFASEDKGMPVAHLSGGQAARASLAKLLLEEPDVLLLDEPTNHLDFAALEWLEGFLGRWKRAYVISSHDRHLLDRAAERIWSVDHGRLKVYTGNYAAFVAQRDEEIEHQWEAYYAQQAYIQKTEDFIRRNIVDKKTTGQAQSRRKQLEKLERVAPPPEDKRIAFEIGFTRPSGQRVFRLQGVSVGYPKSEPGGGPTELFEIEHAILDRGERVALVGPNGSGKTTLLKTLAGQLHPLKGAAEWGHAVELAYFAQATWDYFERDGTLVDALIDQPGWTIPKARNLLGQFLFSGDEVFKKLEELSGGERSRVALARLAQLGGNLLLLDEPTNHLDIPAREILEQVLKSFQGSILFVSHDRTFIQTLATQVWEVDADGKLHLYKGDYDFYRRKKEVSVRAASSASAQDRAAKPKDKKMTPGKRKRLQERERAKLHRREAELAERIQALEARIAELERDLEAASYAQDLERINATSSDYEAAKSDLNQAYAAWDQVASELEQTAA